MATNFFTRTGGAANLSSEILHCREPPSSRARRRRARRPASLQHGGHALPSDRRLLLLGRARA